MYRRSAVAPRLTSAGVKRESSQSAQPQNQERKLGYGHTSNRLASSLNQTCSRLRKAKTSNVHKSLRRWTDGGALTGQVNLCSAVLRRERFWVRVASSDVAEPGGRMLIEAKAFTKRSWPTGSTFEEFRR